MTGGLASFRGLLLCTQRLSAGAVNLGCRQPTQRATRGFHVGASALGLDNISMPIGPAVRRLLMEHELDPTRITASGRNGRILKGDVLLFLETGGTIPAPTGKVPVVVSTRPRKHHFDDLPLTNMRKTIASRLTESKTTIPHSYSKLSIDISTLTKLRKEKIAETGVKFSLNDVIIKASSLALRAVPEINSSWQGQVVPSMNVDISIAVATPNGLITPIISRADQRSVVNISETLKDLAGRAKENKLQPEEFQGGTFTISNLGMFGITEFTAVINPPQSCILAVGGAKPVVNKDSSIGTHVGFTLCYDARVADDKIAADWLASLRNFLQNPSVLI